MADYNRLDRGGADDALQPSPHLPSAPGELPAAESDGLLRIVTEQLGGRTVLRLQGELDLATAGMVDRCLADCVQQARRAHVTSGPDHSEHAAVEVDLEDLEFIDASGLSVLVVARRDLERAGRRLEVRGAHGVVERVFNAAGLDGLLAD